MGRHNKKSQSSAGKAFAKAAVFTGGLAVSAAALLSSQGIAGADTGQGTVFGKDTSSVLQSTDAEWTNMIQAEKSDLQDPFYQKARNSYMAQFNECSSLLLGPMSDCVNEKVNMGANRIKSTSWNIGFQAPAETIATGVGDSSSVVALEVDILENKLGVPAEQLLVTKVMDHGQPFTILLAQAPDGGVPGPDSLVLSNIPAPRTLVSAVSTNWSLVRGTAAAPVAVEAFKPYGLPKGPGVG